MKYSVSGRKVKIYCPIFSTDFSYHSKTIISEKYCSKAFFWCKITKPTLVGLVILYISNIFYFPMASWITLFSISCSHFLPLKCFLVILQSSPSIFALSPVPTSQYFLHTCPCRLYVPFPRMSPGSPWLWQETIYALTLSTFSLPGHRSTYMLIGSCWHMSCMSWYWAVIWVSCI